ncbi:Alpha-ketoglutarate-dependent taurine dioxygenase [Andreprevotia sp. IGB-42]|uniref:taurine dioxygenase n=1 Tax=Andreprevotia sp. IGB-42 TaxID=2497473 RepID=UPI00135B3EE0|nr:taurine dioxygenase [Andreprevotia sp. IGB-42]KAF0815325.1 Alpha-ketoglutarate-dependent taurine dioxygenase [Andreprevotia sp. IGB-42]
MTQIHITPLSPALGAIVEGVALAAPLDDAIHATLTEALLRHQVLFFRNQPLTPVQQRNFARHFGDLHIHPIYPNVPETPEILVLDTHADNLPDNDNWHTDVTFIATPPLGAVLAAKQLPPTGGDTLWSSGTAAYNALSPQLQALLDGLTATHDFALSFPASRHAISDAGRAQWEATRVKHPPRSHPVIRIHPVTGHKAIFVNEGFSLRINELPQRESRALLDFLFAHVARPEFTVRWRWQENDVAFWDNRITQHYAVADYLPARRIMHRATILGDAPY